MNGDFENKLKEIAVVLERLSGVVERLSEEVRGSKTSGVRAASKITAAAKKKVVTKKRPVSVKKKVAAKRRPVSVKKKPVDKKESVSAKEKSSPTEQVLEIMKRFRKGISIEVLRKKSGFNEKQISNIVHRAAKKGIIKKLKRGVYKAS